jgi:hypothetical protein
MKAMVFGKENGSSCFFERKRERDLKECERPITFQYSSFRTTNFERNFRRCHKRLLTRPFHGMNPS